MFNWPFISQISSQLTHFNGTEWLWSYAVCRGCDKSDHSTLHRHVKADSGSSDNACDMVKIRLSKYAVGMQRNLPTGLSQPWLTGSSSVKWPSWWWLYPVAVHPVQMKWGHLRDDVRGKLSGMKAGCLDRKRTSDFLDAFLARDVIYTSRAYATMSVSGFLSVCLWRKCIGTLGQQLI